MFLIALSQQINSQQQAQGNYGLVTLDFELNEGHVLLLLINKIK